MKDELTRPNATKRRYLNLLIAFESTLIFMLTLLAVHLRDAGNLLSFKSGPKEYILLAAFPMIWLICLSIFGSWDLRILDNHIDGYRLLMGASTLTFLTFCSASYLFKIQISRFVILFSLFGGTLLHLCLRWLFLRYTDKIFQVTKRNPNWLVITDGEKIEKAVSAFIKDESASPYYFIMNKHNFEKSIGKLGYLVNSQHINQVVLATPASLQQYQIQKLLWCVQEMKIDFVTFDNIGLTANRKTKHFGSPHWVGIGEPRINESQRVLKRLFDLALVIPSIIILIPFCILIALIIRLDSPGNIFHKQQRIGQNGVLFYFPKFRSMKQGSENSRFQILGKPDSSIVERYRSDPRITRVGKFLRRYSLDELPQLWCVLIGTMSLVGPRPILVEEESQLGDFDFRRHIAKPGLTGIWQVSGRKETSWEERMVLDLKYIETWSVYLDLILIAKTFKSVIKGTGAY